LKLPAPSIARNYARLDRHPYFLTESLEVITSQLAELSSVPARIVDIDDAKALEWQLAENSQRADVNTLLPT